MAHSRIYLGTMTFGWEQASSPVSKAVAIEMAKIASRFGLTVLDTARIYSEGESEPMVGACLEALQNDESVSTMKVTTKAHPSQPGGLSPRGLEAQLMDSLKAMNVKRVDEFYLHQPDTECSLESTLEKTNELVDRGLIGSIGMSNYHGTEVQRAVDICDKYGWVRPSVYQGLYNPLNRRVETELLPTLKHNNIKFIAFNALAAGLLTGKHASQDSDSVMSGRFKNNPNYLPRFYTKANFKAVSDISDALEYHGKGETMIEATYDWLLHHSQLGPNDGILIGASGVEQLESTLSAIGRSLNKSPKHTNDQVMTACEKAWDTVIGSKEGDGFAYWRGYSKDHPNAKDLDQGAAYAAHGPKK